MAAEVTTFKEVASRFASGVTVITTGRDGDYKGLTASAFISLSIEPMSVVVAIDRNARTLPVVQKTGAFNVNILASDQERLSRLFASQSHEGMDDADYHLGISGIPLLDGTLAYLECRTSVQYDGGDHVIFVGEVEAAGYDTDKEPLLFYNRKYRHFEDLEAETSPGVAARADLT